jgi:hypothetical protein
MIALPIMLHSISFGSSHFLRFHFILGGAMPDEDLGSGETEPSTHPFTLLRLTKA